MTTRLATLADVPAIVEMGRAFLRASTYQHVYRENPAQMASLAERLITGEASDFLLLEHDGVLAGMLGLMR